MFWIYLIKFDFANIECILQRKTGYLLQFIITYSEAERNLLINFDETHFDILMIQSLSSHYNS